MIKALYITLVSMAYLFSESFSEQFPFIMHTLTGNKEAAIELLHPDFTVKDLDKDSYHEKFNELFDQSRKMQSMGKDLNIDQHFIVKSTSLPSFPIDGLSPRLNADFKKFFERQRYADMSANQVAVYITIRINDGDPVDGLMFLFEEVNGKLLALHLDD